MFSDLSRGLWYVVFVCISTTGCFAGFAPKPPNSDAGPLVRISMTLLSIFFGKRGLTSWIRHRSNAVSKMSLRGGTDSVRLSYQKSCGGTHPCCHTASQSIVFPRMEQRRVEPGVQVTAVKVHQDEEIESVSM